jgi:DNA-binding NarL/FixJ family response regulator
MGSVMSPTHNLRVAIASDQAIARRGLSALVMSVRGVELVGQATTLAEMLQLCELTEPALLLIDLRTPFERDG